MKNCCSDLIPQDHTFNPDVRISQTGYQHKTPVKEKGSKILIFRMQYISSVKSKLQDSFCLCLLPQKELSQQFPQIELHLFLSSHLSKCCHVALNNSTQWVSTFPYMVSQYPFTRLSLCKQQQLPLWLSRLKGRIGTRFIRVCITYLFLRVCIEN